MSSPVAWDEMVCVLLNAVLLNVVTCCLVVASAWGHRYLRQWIEYHMLAGAHKFFLASNEVCMHGRVHTTPSNARTRMRMAQLCPHCDIGTLSHPPPHSAKKKSSPCRELFCSLTWTQGR